VGDNSVVGPYFGGEAKLSGKLVMWAQGVPAVNFGLAAFGGPAGGTTIATLLGLPITVTGGPWVTGAVPVTGITTNVVSFNGVIGAGVTLRVTVDQTSRALSTGGGFVSTNGGLPLEYHTVTLSGANQLLSADQSGMVTLVSPMRVNSGPAISGRTPGAAWMDLYFVPEPGTVLLLVSGAIGLAVIGRRRMRQ
jgi:hypothetical protein